MPRLPHIAFPLALGISAAPSAHAVFISQQFPDPPSELRETGSAVLTAVADIYLAVARIERGEARASRQDLRGLSDRLHSVAHAYGEIARNLHHDTPIDLAKLPSPKVAEIEHSLRAGSWVNDTLGVGERSLVVPRTKVAVFEQSANVIRALAERVMETSNTLTDDADADAVEAFSALNTAVSNALYVMTVHSFLLSTTQ